MISGSIVALVTPMLDDGNIDWEALGQLIDWHVVEGTNAIVIVGTTGESATLNFDEHCKAIEFAVKRAGGRIPVIAGTGANSTREAVYLTQKAEALGVDACLIVTPYYNKPTQEGMYQHFKAIVERTNVDIILYNVPGRTSVDLTNDTALRLSEFPRIIGIKDATGDIVRGTELINRAPEGFSVYSGDDGTARELICNGARGDISVTANVAPRWMSEMCRHALNGDVEQAETVDIRLAGLHSKLFCESNPIPVKWALYRMGLCKKGIRLPLTVLATAQQSLLEIELEKAGLIKATNGVK